MSTPLTEVTSSLLIDETDALLNEYKVLLLDLSEAATEYEVGYKAYSKQTLRDASLLKE